MIAGGGPDEFDRTVEASFLSIEAGELMFLSSRIWHELYNAR